MTRHARVIRRVKRRPHEDRRTFALLPPVARKTTPPLPRLCPHDAHAFRFVDRVQLGLPDAGLGGYPLASYVACTRCAAVVEFLGVCAGTTDHTRLSSAWLLFPDGTGVELPLPARRVRLVAHG